MRIPVIPYKLSAIRIKRKGVEGWTSRTAVFSYNASHLRFSYQTYGQILCHPDKLPSVRSEISHARQLKERDG